MWRGMISVSMSQVAKCLFACLYVWYALVRHSINVHKQKYTPTKAKKSSVSQQDAGSSKFKVLQLVALCAKVLLLFRWALSKIVSSLPGYIVYGPKQAITHLCQSREGSRTFFLRTQKSDVKSGAGHQLEVHTGGAPPLLLPLVGIWGIFPEASRPACRLSMIYIVIAQEIVGQVC